MAAIPSDLKKKAMSAEVPSHEQLLYSTMVSLSPGGGGYSMYPLVGRCGAAPITLTLFKTNITDFPTLFKTEFRFFNTLFKTFTRILINKRL